MRLELMLACWHLQQADSNRSQHNSDSEQRHFAEGNCALACVCITWATGWWCRGACPCLPRQPLELCWGLPPPPWPTPASRAPQLATAAPRIKHQLRALLPPRGGSLHKARAVSSCASAAPQHVPPSVRQEKATP